MERETLLYALLFSVPPAIGLMGFFTVLLGGGVVNPWGIAIGLAVGAGLFALVAKAAEDRPVEAADRPDADR